MDIDHFEYNERSDIHSYLYWSFMYFVYTLFFFMSSIRLIFFSQQEEAKRKEKEEKKKAQEAAKVCILTSVDYSERHLIEGLIAII